MATQRNALSMLVEPLVVRAVRLEGNSRVPVPLGNDGSTVVCNGTAAQVAQMPWVLALKDGSHEIIVLDAEGKVLTMQISSVRPMDPVALSMMGSAPSKSRMLANRVARQPKRLPCIAPGCKNESRGPRFHYLCKKHTDAPKADFRRWQKADEARRKDRKAKARADARKQRKLTGLGGRAAVDHPDRAAQLSP